jgi:predicted metalloendopeptidase
VAPLVRAITLEEAGLDPSWMDRTADACQDFYALACGGLITNVEIPPDKASWGSTQKLQLRNEELLRSFLEKAAKGPGNDPVQKKLGAWYGACMDEVAIEEAGTAPLAALLAVVGEVRDKKTLDAAVIELHRRGIFPLFSPSSQQDFKDATQVIAGLDQDGLGLPDRDFYLLDDPTMKAIRAFYAGHVERLLILGGDRKAAARKATEDVMRIETALATLAQDKAARRDPYQVYHRVDRRGLAGAARGFPWNAYWKALGFPELQAISVNSVPYFAGAFALLAAEKPAAWKSYLRWMVLSSQASRLGKAFVDERFRLRQKLVGQEEIEPRWKRCVQSTDRALGELLAQPYVKLRFDAPSKRLAEDLLGSVRAAMKVELGALPWMDQVTRAAAEDKLSRMNDKVGYPVRWRTYDFDVQPSAYAENALASDAFELSRSLRKVGQPLDRTEWQMTPPTVNAYYDASLNEMVFPAGILQAPFFDKAFTPAVNFGSTGAVMGHELTHGFDDEGSQFDGLGNLRDWWSEPTGKLFQEQTTCVVDQYSAYEALPGVKLNGQLTLGENIADIGGLKIALSAFREARKASPDRVAAEGFGEDQLFFLAYAQSWCEKARPELLDLMAKTNAHAPPRFRVDGVVADLPAFAEAFSCQEGSPMRPAKVCAVW